MDRGWVKSYRKIEDWEWYKKPLTAHLFQHLIRRANHTAKKWQGFDIPAGCLVTSIPHLAEQTGLSQMQVKTALGHLYSSQDVEKVTDSITDGKKANFTVLKVKNYALYQDDNRQYNRPITDEQPTDNRPITTNKNVRSKEVKKERKKPIYDAGSVIQERYHSPKLIDAWMAFLEMRKSKKKPVSTERALTLLMKDLDRYGQTDDQKIAVLEQSVKNSWQGLYPLKGNDYGSNRTGYQNGDVSGAYDDYIPWDDYHGNV